MAIGLIIIGDEILSGKRQDKHFAKVRELLAARGLGLAWVQYLGDDRSRLTEVLRQPSRATMSCSVAVESVLRRMTIPARPLPPRWMCCWLNIPARASRSRCIWPRSVSR
jgi:hypothetical protein